MSVAGVGSARSALTTNQTAKRIEADACQADARHRQESLCYGSPQFERMPQVFRAAEDPVR